MYFSIGTPKHNKFSICPKWKINYFYEPQYLSTLVLSDASHIIIFMPPQRSWEGHIVLLLWVRTSVTLFSTVLVSTSPPEVFDAGT